MTCNKNTFIDINENSNSYPNLDDTTIIKKNECAICFFIYADKDYNIICKNNHQICKFCHIKIYFEKNRVCPFCREELLITKYNPSSKPHYCTKRFQKNMLIYGMGTLFISVIAITKLTT